MKIISELLQRNRAFGAWSCGRYCKNHGTVRDIINPANSRVLARVEDASSAGVNAVVQPAQKAQQIWSEFKGIERARILWRAASMLREHLPDWAQLEMQNTGKPIRETTTIDLPSAIEALEWSASLAQQLHGEAQSIGADFFYTRREPLGVCAAIGAWNYPLQIACWKTGPALACGNAVVFKPSEHTPLTALALGPLLQQAGLPDGVFNVICGAGATGEALVTHTQVHKVSLTGSSTTGKRILVATAPMLRPVTMELGGKSPLIIFADAPLQAAVTTALQANFYSQGAVCSNGTRVFVHKTIFDAFAQQVVAATQALVIGDPAKTDTQVGALINADHYKKIDGYIASARADGRPRLLCGGEQITVAGCEAGIFLAPAIFALDDMNADQADKLKIAREEIFGPVMVLAPFTEEAEVITRANATPYGLAAGVFTRDLARAHRVVARLKAGTCWINTFNLTPVEMPFGGIKESGFGRENGRAVLEAYTQMKSIYVAGNEAPPSF